MSDAVMIAFITGIPSILTSLATLVFIIKGNYKLNALDKTVNGKVTEMINMVKDTSETRGKVETIEGIIKSRAANISSGAAQDDRRKQ